MHKSLKIYIASSFKNIHAVQCLRDKLRENGHTVLDFTNLAPPLSQRMTPENRKLALDCDNYGNIFQFCTQSCASADLVIYLGASGQDSACEVGIAYGAGVPVVGLAGVLEKPGTIMAKAVTTWVKDVKELITEVEKLSKLSVH